MDSQEDSANAVSPGLYKRTITSLRAITSHCSNNYIELQNALW